MEKELEKKWKTFKNSKNTNPEIRLNMMEELMDKYKIEWGEAREIVYKYLNL